MIRAIHLNLSHREVVFVVDSEGSPHGVPLILSDGRNGLPTFEQFAEHHQDLVELLTRSLETLVAEHPDTAHLAPQAGPATAEDEPAAEPDPDPDPAD